MAFAGRLTELQKKEIIGMYWLERAKVAEAITLVNRLAMSTTSTKESELYGFLGMNPEMREWVTDRVSRTLNEESFRVVNRQFEITIGVSILDVIRGNTPQLAARLGQIADVDNRNWEKLLFEVLLTNPLGYDGVSFFNAAHPQRDTSLAAQANLLTNTQVGKLDIATAASPTPLQVSDAVMGVIQYMLGIKDDWGNPLGSGCRQFLVLVPINFWSVFAQAFGLGIIQGASEAVNNPLQATSADGFQISFTARTELTSDPTPNSFYTFATDAPIKPFIAQSEYVNPVEINEDRVWRFKEFDIGFDVSRAVAPGMWQFATKATFS